MIAVDSSTWIAFLGGAGGRDVELLDEILKNEQALLPPVVLTELLSHIATPERVINWLSDLPVMTISTGYWQRAGHLRTALLAKKLKARIADTLIAQSCLDYDVPLLTRDNDFRHYASVGSLMLVAQK